MRPVHIWHVLVWYHYHVHALRERARTLRLWRLYRIFNRPALRRLGKFADMERPEKGKTIRWRAVNGIRKGVIEDQFIHPKKGEFMGYKVRLPNGKMVIVSPKSILTCESQ